MREFVTPIVGMALFGFVLLTNTVAGDKSIGLFWDEWSMMFYIFFGMLIGVFTGGLMIYLFPLMSPFPKWSVIKKP
ncbi:hypothetical protein ES703_110424 [subsurface metagenome]